MLANTPWPSFIELEKKLETFFGKNNFCICSEGYKSGKPGKYSVNLVLFGDGILALQNLTQTKTCSKFKLWSLSNAHKKLICTLFNIPSRYIAVIPRYKLYPATLNKKMSKGPYSLISSSSIVTNKNVDFCIQVMNFIQKKTPLSSKIFICGPNMKNDTQEFKALVNNFEWKSPPLLLGDLGTRWTDYPFKNPLLLNFSTSLFEDYGVSVAQAQSKGWPLILSDWGAHRDVAGKNVIKIPFQWVLQRQVNKVVSKISDEISNPNECFCESDIREPQEIDSHKLKNYIRLSNLKAINLFYHGYKGNLNFHKKVKTLLGNLITGGMGQHHK